MRNTAGVYGPRIVRMVNGRHCSCGTWCAFGELEKVDAAYLAHRKYWAHQCPPTKEKP